MSKLFYILVIILTTSCASKTIVKVIHKPLVIPTQCNFDKFTDEEKATITNQVGMKIYKNQQSCVIRQIRINDIIKAHNSAHNKD